MTLSNPDQAEQACKRVLETSMVPVLLATTDPVAERQPMALAGPDTSFVFLLEECPQVFSILRESGRPLGTLDAKRHEHLLRHHNLPRPERWACARTSEQLIRGTAQVKSDLSEILEPYDISPPPSDASLEGLTHRASAIAQLVTHQIDALKKDNLTRVSRIEAQVVGALCDLEANGMPLVRACWEQCLEREANRLRELRDILRDLLGDPDDRNLLGEVDIPLDDDAKLRPLLRRKGFKVDSLKRESLRSLPSPLSENLIEYRKLSRFAASYGEGFLRFLDHDGRVRPTLDAIGASTGRLACRDPNLQSLVKDDARRACIRPAEGRCFVVADYAACELRILAEMSGETAFLDAFARGSDLHSDVARSVFGKRVSKNENAHLRERAKIINFGLAYGMGAGGLAQAADIGRTEADQLLRRYFDAFPRLRQFLQDTSQEAVRRGYAQSLSGRRLKFSELASQEPAQWERIAKNMPIQGSNADIIKIALSRLHNRYRDTPDTWLVNVVHDEIIVECPQEKAQPVLEDVVADMKAAGSMLLRKVTLEVSAEIQPYWRKS